MDSVQRYESVNAVHTNLDKFGDVVGWIEGLRSREYLTELIAARHRLNIQSRPREIAARLTPLMEISLQYLNQALSGPDAVAYVPLYYSFLNLSKIYILLGPYAQDFTSRPAHRHHGASYNPAWPDGLNASKQRIDLRPNGVLGLFYRTLSGQRWISSTRSLTMSNVYPYITQCSAELTLFTNQAPKHYHVYFLPERIGASWHLQCRVTDYRGEPLEATPALAGLLPVLKPGMWQISEPHFISRASVPSREDAIGLQDYCIRRELLYLGQLLNPQTGTEAVHRTPRSFRLFDMVEEFPIILAFFYLSNIFRYKPEFAYQLSQSKMWPFLVALRRHATYTFLLAFWQFINQETTYVTTE